MLNEIYNEIEKHLKEKVVNHLLHKRNIIEFNLNFSFPLSFIGLCTDEKEIQSFLEQLFRENGLKYYNSLGGLIENPNEYEKYISYRFESNEKRLEFIENLLIELQNE